MSLVLNESTLRCTAIRLFLHPLATSSPVAIVTHQAVFSKRAETLQTGSPHCRYNQCRLENRSGQGRLRNGLGTMVASGSSDRTVRVWEVSSGRALHTFEGHASWVQSVAFSADGTRLVSGSTDKTVRVWEVSSGRALRAFEGFTSEVQSVAFSPDSKYLVSTSDDRTARIWDSTTGSPILLPLRHRGPVTMAVFSPEEMTFIS